MIFSDLPKGSAGVILADPPWAFKTYSKKDIHKAPDAHYDCMGLEDIKALPVNSLADLSGCALLLWCTWPMLRQGLAVMDGWGFTYKTGGSWAKMSKSGNKVAFGTGYIYRSASEFWLLGTIGKPKTQSRSVRNVIIAPVREHSRKPEELRIQTELLFKGPYVELFARQQSPGWLAWGNQTQLFSEAA